MTVVHRQAKIDPKYEEIIQTIAFRSGIPPTMIRSALVTAYLMNDGKPEEEHIPWEWATFAPGYKAVERKIVQVDGRRFISFKDETCIEVRLWVRENYLSEVKYHPVTKSTVYEALSDEDYHAVYGQKVIPPSEFFAYFECYEFTTDRAAVAFKLRWL